MIEMYLLEQLVAVAKHKTLLAAADALHITQPALTRSMKKLENYLDLLFLIITPIVSKSMKTVY